MTLPKKKPAPIEHGPGPTTWPDGSPRSTHNGFVIGILGRPHGYVADAVVQPSAALRHFHRPEKAFGTGPRIPGMGPGYAEPTAPQLTAPTPNWAGRLMKTK